MATKEEKENALTAIGGGIQQMQWQAAYMASQIEALPALGEDASEEQKQGRAKQRVQVDAVEQKIEAQLSFYEFCKNN